MLSKLTNGIELSIAIISIANTAKNIFSWGKDWLHTLQQFAKAGFS
jgi:hypothetical protein